MSLDRFIFCPCTHALEAHGNRGCTACACSAAAREVIDGLLAIERDAIRRTWLGSTPTPAPAELRIKF
jgi:hypothetical protein